MPELPEIETIRLALQATIIGKTVADIQVLKPKQFIGDKSAVIGSAVAALQRKGKYLAIKMSNQQFISVHLKMSGQLFYSQASADSPYTRIQILFTDGSRLVFNDMRMFGWVKVSDRPEEPRGHDVLDSQFSQTYLAAIARKSHKPIKTLLLDQDKIAGIGNIYANDALYVAGINPQRQASDLTNTQIVKLYQAIKDVISEGIAHKGSSASHVYRLPDGSKGSYQDRFKVYSREGEPCLNCKTSIERIVIAGRGTFFCPQCQM